MLLTETKIKKTGAQNTYALLSFGGKNENFFNVLQNAISKKILKKLHAYFERLYFLSLLARRLKTFVEVIMTNLPYIHQCKGTMRHVKP